MLPRSVLASLLVVLCLAGCGMVDPQRPVPYPDTVVFGNFVESTPVEGEENAFTVRLQVGIPRALTQAKESEGQAPPELEKGNVAEIRVSTDTVLILSGQDATLDDFDPGTEIVVIPVTGTTRMIGEDRILIDGAHILDFVTYRDWKLPGLATGTGEEVDDRVDRINTPGIEQAPVPSGDGTVLYFTARLREAAQPGGPLIGPRRTGLASAEARLERTYRTELTDAGWTAPELVEFPDLEATSISISWVDDSETLCLVTVGEGSGNPWIGRSERQRTGVPWGPVQRLSELGESHATDGVFMAGSTRKMAFCRRAPGFQQMDLFMLDPDVSPSPQLLAPMINTPSDEWRPRIGPNNELFFCRADRQMVLAKGEVRTLLLPGPHRRVLSQAAPTRDGRWVFFCRPRLTPVELDQDIYVAEWLAPGKLGEPVPVDEWRPGQASE
jgi:hypothetical protein